MFTSPGPVAFTVFGIDIMWYGILIAIGFMLAVFISYKRAPSHGIEPDTILDFAIWMIPICLIGARAYYVLFNLDYYGGNLSRILDVRAGGLAIHGGLIAGTITGIVFCRVKKIRFLDLADLIFPQVALAQSIGRWGNFFNSEAHGGPTDLPWAVLVDGQSVHPTFLYESIWCFLLFWFLLYVDKRNRPTAAGSDTSKGFSGRIVLLYGMIYSVERFFVEQLRTDSLMLGPFKQAQLLSAFVFISCFVLYILLQRRSLSEKNS